MAITWANVTAAYPQDATLAAVDADAEGAIYVSWAETRARADVLGAVADQVHINLAAHFGSLGALGAGGGGAVVSESVDGVSRSYGAPPAWAQSSDLGETLYGRRAMSVMRNASRARLPRVA